MNVSTNVRLYIGVILLILAFIAPLFGFAVAKTSWSLALKTTIIGLLAAGIPEVLIFLAAAILGKANYERIKSKTISVLKILRPTAAVSKTRYKIGLFMFFIPILPTYIMAYVPQWLPDSSPERLYVNLAADIIFLASFFVLGGDFWDKLTALFTYEAKISFKDES
jgi:hypothetical protein